MRILCATAIAAMLLLPRAAAAQSPAAPPADARVLDTAVVRGVLPGPGMWKVTSGGNTLWVLGVQSPLPAGMEWEPGKTLSVIRKADAAIAPPGFSMGTKIGFFSRLALVPSLLKVRANPDGKLLKDVVPAPLYARWLALKPAYLGRDASVEKWRPIFAALTLYEAGMKKSGLSDRSVVEAVVAKALKERGITPMSSTVSTQIADPKGAIRDFRAAQVADLACFEKTLERLEGDLGHMRQRANAWAIGDVATLRGLPVNDQMGACMRALTQSTLGRKFGLDDLYAQARGKWLDNAGTALRTHRVTFATLPMSAVIGPDSLIDGLAAKGYQVEAPR